MLIIENTNVRKSRTQQIGRDQDFGSFRCPAASYLMPVERLLSPHLLQQEDLDSATILPQTSTMTGVQVIESQKTLLGVLIRQRQDLAKKIRKIRDTHKERRKAEWQRVKTKYAKSVTKVWWMKSKQLVKKPGRSVRVRFPEGDTFREVEVWGPRKRFPLMDSHGRPSGRYEVIRTTRKIKIRKKAFTKKLLYGPRIYKKTVRIPNVVQVADWDKIRFEYARFRILDHNKQVEELKPLQEKYQALQMRIKNTGNQFYAMRTYSTEFCGGLKSTQISSLGKVQTPDWRNLNGRVSVEFTPRCGSFDQMYLPDYSEVFGVVYGSIAPRRHYGLKQIMFPKMIYDLSSIRGHYTLEALNALLAQEDVGSSSFLLEGSETVDREAAELFRFKPPQLINPDGLSDKKCETAEQLAASNVMALKGSQDYVFNMYRSVGELKDTTATLKQGKEFIAFCKQLVKGRTVPDSLLRRYQDLVNARHVYGTVRYRCPELDKALALKAQMKAYQTGIPVSKLMRMGLKQLVGLHLAWKFAVAPTIDDINTVCSQTRKWLADVRRLCSKMIDNQRKSTILHMRSAWRESAERRHEHFRAIKVDAPESVTAQGDVVLSLPVPLRGEYHGIQGTPPEGFDYRTTHRPTCLNFAGFDEITISDVVKTGSDYKSWTGRSTIPERTMEVRTSLGRSKVHIPASTQWIKLGPYSDIGAGQTFVGDEPVLENEQIAEKALLGIAWLDTFAVNETRGVVFANYNVDDVLDFVDCSYDDSLLGAIKHVLDETNALVVAWELTPLSFIEDWFLNTGALARGLQNLVSTLLVEPPGAEIWATRKYELLTGVQTPKLATGASNGVISEITDWYKWREETETVVNTQVYSSTNYFASPKTVRFGTKYSFDLSRSCVLGPSGLRTAFRGPLEYSSGGPTSSWLTFANALRPRVNVNAGKLVTLAEMLMSMLL